LLLTLQSRINTLSKDEVLLLSEPRKLGQTVNYSGLLNQFLARELFSSEIHIEAIQSIPVMESLSGAVLVMHLGLEQLAPEYVLDDHGGHGALPARWIFRRPIGGVGRIAGLGRPRCPDGGLQSLEWDSVTAIAGGSLHSPS
jgi:hypothetical protein